MSLSTDQYIYNKNAVAAPSEIENRYFETGTALYRLFSEAPYLPRCSDNKTAALVRPKKYAIRYPYMQVNRPGMVSWLVFDLDHSNSYVWEDEGLPAPNLVVTNRKNNHSHLFYAISPVCTTENGRSKPIQYMKAVYEAMCVRLRADHSYSGPVAKTPGHPWWRTLELHPSEYELGDLADYLDLEVKPLWSTGPDLESVSHSRHCLLFEELRFYAYSIVNKEREKGSFSSFLRLLEANAFNKNNYRCRGFAMNLSVSQVRATVKSVARWTWDRYTGNSQCHRGVMSLDASLTLGARQKLAAERTHELRKKGTEEKIRLASKSIKAKKERPTLLAIAKATGLCRQTVARYKHVIKEPYPTPPTKITPRKKRVNPVKYAVHQISAVLVGPVGCLKRGQTAVVTDKEVDTLGDYVNSAVDPPVS